MENESRLQEAMADLQVQSESLEKLNIASTARKYSVHPSTLSRRWRGVCESRQDVIENQKQALTSTQEETLIDHVNKLTSRGLPPTPQILKNIAESIAHKTLGLNWTHRFCKRHRKRLASVYLTTIDHKRKVADNSKFFNYFFGLVGRSSLTLYLRLARVTHANPLIIKLQQKLEKYDVEAKNIYNFDEKGFMIGFSRTKKRIVSVQALKRKRIIGASHDGNREFITCMATCRADGASLPPALIYAGESPGLQSSWVEDFDAEKDRVWFASSKNGWSDDKIGLGWIEEYFERLTGHITSPRDYRLLIVDGHSSHVNLEFITFADAHRILLAILPPHSTHRLQPLDVGLFGPLSNYYSQAIDRLLVEGQGITYLSKRDFYSLFIEAWSKAFTANNIRSAWEATGLHPLNALKVTVHLDDDVLLKEEQSDTEFSIRQPTSVQFRRQWRDLEKRGYIDSQARPMLHAFEAVRAQKDILNHENQGLRHTLIREKKKRRRGKPLVLYDEDEVEAQGLFFSPAKVARAQERMRLAEEEQAQQQRTKSDRKLQKAIERQEKANKAIEKRIERQNERERVREQARLEKEERRYEKEAAKILRASEAAKRKRDIESRRAERMRLKESKEQLLKSKKRTLQDEESIEPRKRRRITAPRSLSAGDSLNPLRALEAIVYSDSLTKRSAPTASLCDTSTMNQSPVRITQSGRSGRAIKLPTRFR